MKNNNDKQETKNTGDQKLLYAVGIALLLLYGFNANTIPQSPLIKGIACIASGEFTCKPSPAEIAKSEFYSKLGQITKPENTVFPDPSPNRLGDSLIPRYYSLRSVLYTYKDGGNSSGRFLPEWWKTYQALNPYLLPEGGVTSGALEVIEKTGADFATFIKPNKSLLQEIRASQIAFQNEYGIIVDLRP